MGVTHAEVRKWGNSLAIIISSEKVRELELSEGQAIDVEIKKCEKVSGFGIFKGAKSFHREKVARDWKW